MGRVNCTFLSPKFVGDGFSLVFAPKNIIRLTIGFHLCDFGASKGGVLAPFDSGEFPINAY